MTDERLRHVLRADADRGQPVRKPTQIGIRPLAETSVTHHHLAANAQNEHVDVQGEAIEELPVRHKFLHHPRALSGRMHLVHAVVEE